jgi:hypothetical protein
MRTYVSLAVGAPASIRIWQMAGLIGATFYTVPNALFGNAAEVPVTIGMRHGIVENPPVHDVLWTQLAVGGCTPFAALVKQIGRNDTRAFALAHLCFNPDQEAQDFGTAMQAYNGTPDNVFLAVIKPPALTVMGEVRNYFQRFQMGFGANIPSPNKLLIQSTPLGTAAITRDGYVGEIDAAAVAALAAPAGGGGGGGPGCCVIL